VVVASYEKAISKMKTAMYLSDIASDTSDKEREKSRKIRFEYFSNVYIIRITLQIDHCVQL